MIPVARTLSRRLVVHNPALSGPIPPADHPAWRKPPPQGLGDWVETWAKPIARRIDRLTNHVSRWARRRSRGPFGVCAFTAILRQPGRPALLPVLKAACGLLAVPVARLLVKAGLRPTRLDGCSACSKRRRLFNTWLPDVRSFRFWLGVAVRIWATLKPCLTSS